MVECELEGYRKQLCLLVDLQGRVGRKMRVAVPYLEIFLLQDGCLKKKKTLLRPTSIVFEQQMEE